MKLENLQRLATHGVAFDTETHLIQPGILAPPLVCASVCASEIEGRILDPAGALEWFLFIIRNRLLIGANIAFDLLVKKSACMTFSSLNSCTR
jgi:hypothetical protein